MAIRIINWIIILILMDNFCPNPKSSFAQDEGRRLRLIEEIGRISDAVESFEECLNHFRIPYKNHCHLKGMTDERNRLKTKYELHSLDLLSHSLQVTLAEHVNLAKLECLPESTCTSSSCNCDATSRPCKKYSTQVSNKTANCSDAHDDLVNRLDIAARVRIRLLRTATTTTLEPGEVPEEYLDYYDLTDPNLTASVRRSQIIRREDKWVRATNEINLCLENFKIQTKAPCNWTELYMKQALYARILGERGGDEGRIPLSLFIDVARVTCRDPSECFRGKCACRDPFRQCVEAPQNKSAKCEELLLEYLQSKSKTNRLTSTTMASGKDTIIPDLADLRPRPLTLNLSSESRDIHSQKFRAIFSFTAIFVILSAF